MVHTHTHAMNMTSPTHYTSNPLTHSYTSHLYTCTQTHKLTYTHNQHTHTHNTHTHNQHTHTTHTHTHTHTFPPSLVLSWRNWKAVLGSACNTPSTLSTTIPFLLPPNILLNKVTPSFVSWLVHLTESDAWQTSLNRWYWIEIPCSQSTCAIHCACATHLQSPACTVVGIHLSWCS